jgi:signal transduction histidine kinase/CheY-like chemotaxis protein/HPt (histidine-containing phosphotransfer) domain-containing protein
MKLKTIIQSNLRELIFIFSAFLCMVLVSYLYTSGIVERHITQNATEVLNLAEEKILAKFREAEITALTVSTFIYNNMEDHRPVGQIEAYLTTVTDSIRASRNDFQDIMGIYAYIDKAFINGNRWIPPENYVPQERPWYTAARRTGDVAFTPPYTDMRTGKLSVSASKSVIGPHGEDYGVIGIDLDLTAIIDYVESLQFAEEGYGLLVSPDLTYIGHPDSTFIGQSLRALEGTYLKIVDDLQKEGNEISMSRLRNSRGVMVITLYRKMGNGWSVGIATPVRSYYREVYLMALILSIMGIFLMLVLSYFIIRISLAKIQSDEENKSKSSFLARVSHEIRTPMNSILGMSELIMRKYVSGEIYEYISIIRQAGNNLLAIINDILDFSKIESGHLQIESKPYFFASLINDVLNVIRVRMIDKSLDFFVSLDSTIPEKLIGDEVRIRQVLINLLNNAIKYTRQGRIDLDVRMERLDAHTVRISFRVSDTGIGIKQEDIDRLFHDFTRLDTDRNHGIEGTGLGLTIAGAYCRAMGGDIIVSSVYGQGSTFTADIIQEFESNKRMASVENPEQKRVLLYEERPLYRASALTAMSNLGITPVCSPDLAAFVKELAEGEYDFAFVSSKYAMECVAAWGRRTSPIELIIMVELGEVSIYRDTGSMLMPIYSGLLANVINGTATASAAYQQDTWIAFSAPSASILIVDDMATNLRVAAGLMEPYNMKIDTCLNGYDAADMIKKNRYDVIFMDHMMPGMDGIQTTTLIRNLDKNDPYFQNVPVIMLTANAISGQREMFFNYGVNDFLAKPIEMQKLNAILERWIPKEKQVKNSGFSVGISLLDRKLPEIQGIKIMEGFKTTGGSRSAYLSILSIFCHDAMERTSQIKRAAEKGNLILYTTMVHALKSAARSIGAMDFADMAAALEDAGKNKNIDLVHEKTDEFLETLRILTENISAALSAEAAEAAEANDSGETSYADLHLEVLKEALITMDTEQVNKLLTGYTAMPLETKIKEFIGELEELVLLFDYDKAVERINTVL